jgi:hypothetical protein
VLTASRRSAVQAAAAAGGAVVETVGSIWTNPFDQCVRMSSVYCCVHVFGAVLGIYICAAGLGKACAVLCDSCFKSGRRHFAKPAYSDFSAQNWNEDLTAKRWRPLPCRRWSLQATLSPAVLWRPAPSVHRPRDARMEDEDHAGDMDSMGWSTATTTALASAMARSSARGAAHVDKHDSEK